MRKENFDGKKPKFIKHIHVIGEAGVVKTRTKTTPKTPDRGVICALVGYANDHEGACYQMYNPESNVLYESRDIVWLKRLYFPNTLPALDRQIEEIDSTEVRESISTELPVVAGENERTVVEDSVDNEIEEESESDGDEEDEVPDLITHTDEAKNANEEVPWREVPRSRYGRTIVPPASRTDLISATRHLNNVMYGAINGELENTMLLPAEEKFYLELRSLNELSLYGNEVIYEEEAEAQHVSMVGAATVGGFKHTSELKKPFEKKFVEENKKELSLFKKEIKDTKEFKV